MSVEYMLTSLIPVTTVLCYGCFLNSGDLAGSKASVRVMEKTLMAFTDAMTSRISQSISLLLLRVTTGFLLIWVGLNKVFSGSAPMAIRRTMDLDQATETIVGLATGSAQVLIGALCVIGLWRRLMLPLQALINGSTAVAVWWAIVDPYRWYITGVDRIVFNSHVFYPTSITFAACVLLITFRREDNWSIDAFRSKQS